jgi:hypothetical protein
MLRGSNGQLCARVEKLGFESGLSYLRHDCRKHFTRGSKVNASLHLDLEKRGVSGWVVGMNDNVVQRVTFGCALQVDAVDCTPW